MPTHSHGRHELGQNFLTDPHVIADVAERVAATTGPIIEIGPGDGALTEPLLDLGRPVTAVEVDGRLASRLRRRFDDDLVVVHTDALRYPLPTTPHVVVGNLPFHLTTALLRRLLHAPGWTDAVLLVQWEVARRRAGVGGSTMMTAQWAPWFEFTLGRRVPAAAFSPRPGVDGGVLLMHRRRDPLVDPAERKRYQAMVNRVYTGRGRGVAEILIKARMFTRTGDARAWCRRAGVAPGALPGRLTVEQWVSLFEATGASPPRVRRPQSR